MTDPVQQPPLPPLPPPHSHHYPSEDGNYLVRVRAQVMSRDDSSGGWVPLGGGGLSNVSVRKKPRPVPPPQQQQQQTSPAPGGPTTTMSTGGDAAPAKPKHDYLIYGKRISDNSIVLSCTIKKDFEYNKVMPTFHHWKTGDKKFGLTFQAAADARAFDKGVRTAVEDLLDGFAETSPSSPLPKCPKDVGDDDVFMTLNLPQEPQDSRSSSDSSTKELAHHHLHHHRIPPYISRDKPLLEPRQPTYEPSKTSENYPYVQLQAVHEYIYPVDEPHKLHASITRRDSSSSLKKPAIGQPTTISTTGGMELSSTQSPTIHHQPIGAGTGNTPSPISSTTTTAPTKKPQQQQHLVCRYCNRVFTQDNNGRGACDFAPDTARCAIDKISCLWCAQCAFYHCCSDAEGEYVNHPCDCGAGAQDDAPGCARRWFCLTLLSVFVPCLWLYPPLKLCHWCGKSCGLCGARHSI